jgi:hypothetical protein
MHDGLFVRVIKCVNAGAKAVDERCMQHIRPACAAEERRLWRPGKLGENVVCKTDNVVSSASQRAADDVDEGAKRFTPYWFRQVVRTGGDDVVCDPRDFQLPRRLDHGDSPNRLTATAKNRRRCL